MSRQFRSDDTDKWKHGFGNGADGNLTIGSNTTDAPIDSSCSGTSGQTALTATNASFAPGQLILIHQSRGTGAGSWELNKIAAYTAGTITTQHALQNTYTDSGNSQAQVLVLKQYRDVTISSGFTLTGKAWNGDVGGILAILAKGTVTIAGTLSNVGTVNNGEGVRNNGGGYRGGMSFDATNSFGGVGESINGDNNNASSSASANGGGGGGGNANFNAGGGGGNGTSGANGQGSDSTNGADGSTAGNASLTTMVFGDAGGGATGIAGMGNNVAGGVNGGGIIIVIAPTIVITGSVTAKAADRSTTNVRANGGGGAGGSILLKGQNITLGTNLVVATGSTITNTEKEKGGNGGVGRIHADYSKSFSGTTNPTIDTTNDLSIKPNLTAAAEVLMLL